MLTRQEMFDRAWNGLKSQDFMQCTRGLTCVYWNPSTSRRCAWGWVDPEGTQDQGSLRIHQLKINKLGVAGTLDDEGERFARELQLVHDSNDDPAEMEEGLRRFASEWSLIVPV